MQDIELSIEPEIYTESKPGKYRAWLQNSLNIFLGARDELVRRNMIDAQTFDNVCAGFRQRIQSPTGVSLFHWDRVSGRKAG